MTAPARPLLAHPIALVFPEIDADTFNDLVASMRTNGYDDDHPVVVFEGKILDGRNRYRAAAIAKVKPAVREFKGTAEEAALFSLRENLHRRHLTVGQRALIVDDLARFMPKEKTGPKPPQVGITAQKCATTPPPDRTARAAATHHVSPRVVTQARELKRIATPDVVKDVKEGRQSLNGALKKARDIVRAVEEPEPVRELDEAKRPIHPAAREALTTERQKFVDASLKLHAVKRAIKAISDSEAGRLVNWKGVETDLENVLRVLRYTSPYTSCPMGDPCDDGCKLCRGTQWVSQSQWDNVPREFKVKR